MEIIDFQIINYDNYSKKIILTFWQFSPFGKPWDCLQKALQSIIIIINDIYSNILECIRKPSKTDKKRTFNKKIIIKKNVYSLIV